MATRPKLNRLWDMDYDEVSVVALGANQESDIVLFKSATGTVTPRGDGDDGSSSVVGRAKAAIALARAKVTLSKMNPNHDRYGRFAASGSGHSNAKGVRGGMTRAAASKAYNAMEDHGASILSGSKDAAKHGRDVRKLDTADRSDYFVYRSSGMKHETAMKRVANNLKTNRMAFTDLLQGSIKPPSFTGKRGSESMKTRLRG